MIFSFPIGFNFQIMGHPFSSFFYGCLCFSRNRIVLREILIDLFHGFIKLILFEHFVKKRHYAFSFYCLLILSVSLFDLFYVIAGGFLERVCVKCRLGRQLDLDVVDLGQLDLAAFQFKIKNMSAL